MRNVKKITELEAKSILSALNYGTTVVQFTTPKAKEITEKAIELVNEITKLNLVRMRQTVDNVLINQQYVEQAIPDTYDLIFSGKPGDCPILKEDDFDIEKSIKKAIESSSVIIVDISQGLFKMANKLANQYGTKFKSKGSEQCFDSSTRSKSTFKQIEDALNSGFDIIEFSKFDNKPQTVRCYVSTINSFYNVNMKVSVKGDIITVKLSDDTIAENALKETFNRLVKSKGLAKATILWKSIVNDIIVDNPATRITTDEEWDEIEKEIKASKKQDDFHEIELEEIERIENENNDEIGYDYRNTIEPEHEVTPEMIDGLIMPDLSKFPQGPDIDTAPYRENEHDF